MRRFFIAAVLGAPLLIASPVMAAVGNSDYGGQTKQASSSASSLAPGKMTLGTLDRLTPESRAAQSGPALAHGAERNGLWWLQVGIGDRWRDGHRHGHDHKKHGWSKKHGHNQWSHWDRDRKHRGWSRDRNHRDWDRGRDRRRDWDDDDRRRHGHRDHDRGRGHRR